MSTAVALSSDVLLGAFGCVCIRGLLNLADRSALAYQGVSLSITLFFNALFPFALMVSLLAMLGAIDQEFLGLLTHPGCILNGLLSHAAASVFYRGFRDLPVRTVSAVSKLSDLFLPVVAFGLGKNLELNNALFAVLTTSLFVPFLSGVRLTGNRSLTAVMAMMVGMPLLQTIANTATEIDKIAREPLAFAKVFTAILAWRMGVVLVSNVRKVHQDLTAGQGEQRKFIPKLIMRSFLAVLAQGLFFYAITRESGALAWPILNAGPLISSVFAHWFLKERLRRTEGVVLVAFAASLIFCLLIASGSSLA
jgi:uncharacterized membrane protein